MTLPIPHVIPDGVAAAPTGPAAPAVPVGNYDFLLDGVGWHFAITGDDPFIETDVPIRSDQPQTENSPGDQSLTDWWRSSQASFHGGAGQKWREPTVPNDWAASRYEDSFNVWPFEPGQVTRLPDTASVYTLPGSTRTFLAASAAAGKEYGLVGQGTVLTRLEFATVGAMSATASTVTWPQTVTAIHSLVADGDTFFASVAYSTKIGVVRGLISSGNPVVIYEADASSGTIVLGWAKGRLVAARGRDVFDLDANVAASANALPSAVFTHSSPTWTASCFAESPSGVLVGGSAGTGGKSDVVELTLDTTTALPTLTGGAQAFELPIGERVTSLRAMMGSFLAVGTSRGVRIATWDGFTARASLGPLSVETPNDVLAIDTRGDYFYASATGMLDGGSESGLLALAPGSVVDENGRRGWAPHQPCPVASTGTVFQLAVLPASGRLLFTCGTAVVVEDSAPGGDRDAWIRTSRIRLGTTEPKLFKWARLRGTVASASIAAYTITPADDDSEDEQLSATFTAVVGQPDEFRLPTGSREWVALRFVLGGSSVALGSYQVSGLPAPRVQWQFNFKALCQPNEQDRNGTKGRHPVAPRARWRHVQELRATGEEVQFTRYDKAGPVTALVTVQRAEFDQSDPPTQEQAFGGTVTFLLRTTEGAA